MKSLAKWVMVIVMMIQTLQSATMLEVIVVEADSNEQRCQLETRPVPSMMLQKDMESE